MSLSTDYGSKATTTTTTTTTGSSYGAHLNGYNNGHNGTPEDVPGLDSITTTTTTTYQGIINSMATLSNIGNSCYLNSVVYTLRFTPNFLHNLHHLVDDLSHLTQMQQKNVLRTKTASLGRNQSGVHHHSYPNGLPLGSGGSSSSGARSMSNKDLVAMANGHATLTNGHGQHLPMNGGEGANHQLKCHRQTATEKLHELYQNLARNENVHHLEPYQPVQLLNAIQDVSSTFEGNQQQDAHEFLMCILDSLRETCQTLNKSYAESSEYQRTLNGVAHLACSDAPMEPSNLSTAQVLASNSGSASTATTTSSSSSSAAAPFKSIFNLKRKSKRKEDKISNAALLPPTGLKPSGGSGGARPPDIDIDPSSSSSSAAAKPAPVSPSEKDPPPIQAAAGDASLVNGTKSESCAEKSPKLESDFFSGDFEGVTVSTTKCLSCETETEQKETMIDIAIPISGHESLESLDNPQAFFHSSCITKEYFRGENKYRCEKCSAYTEAIRSISFEVLPRLLVVQLKRFSGGMEKINSFIPTPFVLQCFCRKCCALPDDRKLHVYRLYSVITHVGATMSAGHYITYTSSLDCYCDYLDCHKEAEKWPKANGVIGGGGGGGAVPPGAVVVDGNGCSNGMDYDVADGKVANLSNPGHHHQATAQPPAEKMSSNLIDKIKKNRLFKNKSSASSSSGIRAKFSLGGSSAVGSSGVAQADAAMNSQNELLEKQLLVDAASAVNRRQIGVAGYQPQVCRSLSCCTIKAKGSFLVKQVASCAEVRGGGGEVGSDWNLYCNNARHSAKFGGGGAESSGDGVTGLDGATGLTTSMSSSSSSATSGSLKQQQQHQQSNGGVLLNGSGGGGGVGRTTRAMAAAGANVSDEPIWYMCDDDKIKSMPQHEFKELLSSNRKIAITPYLLFYARSDL